LLLTLRRRDVNKSADPGEAVEMNQRAIWLGTLVVCGLLAIVLGAIILIPRLLYAPLTATDLRGVTDAKARIELRQAQSQLANDARSAVLQGIAGLLVVVGGAATWRQVRVSREGQITDRFTHAVDQLGCDKPEVRVGGIRALERIATNSKEDRATIAYVLGAFVRVRAPWPTVSPEMPKHPPPVIDEQTPWLQQRAPDVQTAMWVLGRRRPAKEPVQLYLSHVDLRGVHLAEANLTDTQVRHANLARAWMPGIDLSRSDLELTDLGGANLQGANLQGAQLREASLQGTNLHGARLEGADLRGAQSDARTVWPEGFDSDRLRNEGVLVVEVSPDGEAPPGHGLI
jgi:hypothetical protein